jgi:murein L,D-transpeptidase YafK
MRIKRIHILLATFVLAAFALPFRVQLRRPVVAVLQRLRGKKTVADRIEQFGEAVRERLKTAFKKIEAAYPPTNITLVGIKQDNLLEVWVSDPPRLLKSYPILGASGGVGPKLREGDMQVPEGLYRIESLNPNSLYHLALRVDYPNQFDRAKGEADGRQDLGGDIMIHGKRCSVGCLAMGDSATEELFVLAAETGIDNVSVILTPVDFRTDNLPENMPKIPDWAPELYDSIKRELMKLEKTIE